MKFHSHREAPGGVTIIKLIVIVIKRPQEVPQSYRGRWKCHNHKEVQGSFTIIERPKVVSQT